MSKLEDNLSPNHKRLMSIASWAKNFARGLPVVSILFIALMVFSEPHPTSYTIGFIGTEVLITIVGYLVLTGVSLGLLMVVETDINYRSKKEQGDVQ